MSPHFEILGFSLPISFGPSQEAVLFSANFCVSDVCMCACVRQIGFRIDVFFFFYLSLSFFFVLLLELCRCSGFIRISGPLLISISPLVLCTLDYFQEEDEKC